MDAHFPGPGGSREDLGLLIGQGPLLCGLEREFEGGMGDGREVGGREEVEIFNKKNPCCHACCHNIVHNHSH